MISPDPGVAVHERHRWWLHAADVAAKGEPSA